MAPGKPKRGGKKANKASTSAPTASTSTSTKSSGIGILDLMPMPQAIEGIAKYLTWKDLLALRITSRKGKEMADKMWGGLRRFELGDSGKTPYDCSFGSMVGPFPMIFKNCQMLTYINFYWLEWLTDKLLYILLARSPNLVRFRIDFCPNITSRGLLPLATDCKKLKNLALRSMQMNDEILRAMVEHENNQLVKVDLTGNENLSVPGLEAFFQKQPNLEEILLTELMMDISPVITAIANSCPNLKDLLLNESVIGDGNSLINVAEKCRKVNYIHIDKESVPPEIRHKLRRKYDIATRDPCYGDCMEVPPGYCSDDDCLSPYAAYAGSRLAEQEYVSDDDY